MFNKKNTIYFVFYFFIITKIKHSCVHFVFVTIIGCPYVKEGRKAFREFIDVLKTWVFSECGESYEFSQIKCGCVLEGTDDLLYLK